MTSFLTVSQRKSQEAARRRDAAAAIMAELASYAEAKGGRFLIFGSVAKGRMTHGSDIGVLIDFPPEVEPEAWQFVEEACRRHGLSGDIHSVSTTKSEFIDRVSAGAVVLP
jgi:predicted nucleotidyltransferase